MVAHWLAYLNPDYLVTVGLCLEVLFTLVLL